MRKIMTFVPAPAGFLGLGGCGARRDGDLAGRPVAGQPVLPWPADSGIPVAVDPVPTVQPAVRTRPSFVSAPTFAGTAAPTVTTPTVITQTDPTPPRVPSLGRPLS